MSLIRIILWAALLSIATTPAAPQSKVFHDRNAVPGNYFVGLYADPRGDGNEILLEPDQLEFDAWVGIGGDSTKVFSGLVMDLGLPRGIELDGPVIWSHIPGLSTEGIATQGGFVVEFNKECVVYDGVSPAMVARIHFKVDDDFREGSVEVREHVKHGLSLELCRLEGDWWPKPFAEPVHLRLERKQTFWGKIRSFFGS